MKECEEFDSGMSVPEEAVLAMFEVLMGSDETTPVCARFALLDESSKTEFRAALAAAAPFIIAAKRKKMDLQSEALEAWYTITKHEVFSPCYAEERPLLHSMLDRLTNLAEMERTVNELRKSSTDDEIRAEAKAEYDIVIHDLATAWEVATDALNLDPSATIGEWLTAFDDMVAKYYADGYEAGGKDTEDEVRTEERKRVIDDVTRQLLEMWKEHRIEGERKGLDQCHEWSNPPEYAVLEANAWMAQDEAFRLIIGNQLADQALREVEE